MLETIPETTTPILLQHKSISPMLLPLARMNSSAFSFLSDFVLVLLLFIQVPSSLGNDDLFTACSQKFECGRVVAGFPFWGADRSSACGVPELELRCENNITAKMNISQVAYRVLEINWEEGFLIRIAREDSFVGLCPPQFMNSTFNPKVFESDIEGYKNLTIFYGCKDAATIPGTIPFTCKINEVNDQRGNYIQVGDTGPRECNRSVLVPVSTTDWPPIGDLQPWEEFLKKEFEVRLKVDWKAYWDCIGSLGVCGIDKVNQTTCYCPNQSSGSRTCPPPPAPAPALPAPVYDELQSLFDASHTLISSIPGVGYPFLGSDRPDYCGYPGFELGCSNQDPEITIMRSTYKLLGINSQSRTLNVSRSDYTSDHAEVTPFYGCPSPSPPVLSSQFTCNINNTFMMGYFITANLSLLSGTAPSLTSYLTTRNNRVEVPALQSTIVPILVSPTVAQLLGAINQGFELEWSRSLETVHSKLDLAQQVLSLVPLWDAGSWPLYNGGQEKLP
ncbi:hypothetical protein NC652_038865 [Populus alba x Populus x berolinensis]|nr:hypothetical protein NC652_038860 [Populus alba x Populus x berolinensis]KAJ6867803.1 hypothetical protein NC652_038865 [Populus alba x Populus x berolinensis]